MEQCLVISNSFEFLYEGQNCVHVIDSVFKELTGVIEISSLNELKIIRTEFIDIIGDTPVSIEYGKDIELHLVCFSKCEYIGSRKLDGTALRISGSEVSSICDTSFFGCSSSLVEDTNRYVLAIISNSLTLCCSNSSYNRVMRGSGLVVRDSNIKKYSKCIYASGGSFGASVYISPISTATVQDLIFVTNIIIENNDVLESILLNHYGQDVSCEDSFFIDNKSPIILKTRNTDKRLILKRSTFSQDKGSIGVSGNVVLSDNDNTFLNQAKVTLPANFVPHFECFLRMRKTSNLASASSSRLAMFLVLGERNK